MQENAILRIPDAAVRQRLERWLRERGFRVYAVENDPLPARVDVALIWYRGENSSRPDPLQSITGREDRPITLALCPAGAVEAGVAALRGGADDFVLEPFDLAELEIRLERGRQHAQRSFGAPTRWRQSPSFDREIVGTSAEMGRVREAIRRVGPSRATVLIGGETGTGKELAARAIQRASPRAARPFLTVNCAALPEGLLESELFGHEQGAFTGAERRRIGRFEQADRGTLFLDEIGDMCLRTQAKVLRALQEQEFERIGGSRTIRVDVRILAATNQDLGAAIAAGRFRQDLYYRLNVVALDLPPLREHPEDVPLLARRFAAEFARAEGRPTRRFSRRALDALLSHNWPGNVRELRNVIERAVLMGEPPVIDVDDLRLQRADQRQTAAALRATSLPAAGIDLLEVERGLVVQALEQSRWIQRDAAGLLRMSRRKLNYRIRKLGLTHPRWRRNSGPAAS